MENTRQSRKPKTKKQSQFLLIIKLHINFLLATTMFSMANKNNIWHEEIKKMEHVNYVTIKLFNFLIGHTKW